MNRVEAEKKVAEAQQALKDAMETENRAHDEVPVCAFVFVSP